MIYDITFLVLTIAVGGVLELVMRRGFGIVMGWTPRIVIGTIFAVALLSGMYTGYIIRT
jgi:hypothetical protein